MLTLAPGEVGGSETYARGLARALATRGQLPVTAFVARGAPDAGEGLPTEVVAEYPTARSRRSRLAVRAVVVLRSGPVRRRIGPVDAVHYPLTTRVPPLEAPTVVTLHDTLHIEFPRLFPRAERLYRALAYDRSVRRARLVITPSAFVRDRAVALLGIPAGRIRPIHHGLDHDRFAPGDEDREAFLLYPARPWKHKNHARLFEAFALLRRERPGLRLVLTGGGHRSSPPDGVDVKGHVSGDDLAGLYRRASALVFPSLYEGFGQPPLEAMACGCPVAAARAGSLPEICDDAARLFDPKSPADIADAVRDVLDAPDEWRRRGLERAAAFTWDACAAAHEDVYRELLA